MTLTESFGTYLFAGAFVVGLPAVMLAARLIAG